MSPESRIDRLLSETYTKGKISVYDFCAEEWKQEEGIFIQCKAMADELVEDKLVRYLDEQRTEIGITNYGRYWMANGGFLIFLKEGERRIKAEKERHHEQLKEELKEARLKFTHYRIVTYWWSFALSIISFLLSLINLYLILSRT